MEYDFVEKSLDTENMKFYETPFFHIPPNGHAPICILFGQHLAHPPAALLRQQCSEGLHSTGIVQSGSFLCLISFISFMQKVLLIEAIRQMNINILFIIFTVKMVLNRNMICKKYYTIIVIKKLSSNL